MPERRLRRHGGLQGLPELAPHEYAAEREDAQAVEAHQPVPTARTGARGGWETRGAPAPASYPRPAAYTRASAATCARTARRSAGGPAHRPRRPGPAARARIGAPARSGWRSASKRSVAARQRRQVEAPGAPEAVVLVHAQLLEVGGTVGARLHLPGAPRHQVPSAGLEPQTQRLQRLALLARPSLVERPVTRHARHTASASSGGSRGVSAARCQSIGSTCGRSATCPAPASATARASASVKPVRSVLQPSINRQPPARPRSA